MASSALNAFFTFRPGVPLARQRCLFGWPPAALQAITSASEITDDLGQAIAWFKYQPIAAYGYKTPADLVADGHSEAVLAYIEDCRNGVYA